MSWTSTISKICLVGWKDDKTVWQKRGRDRINQRFVVIVHKYYQFNIYLINKLPDINLITMLTLTKA